MEFFYKKIANIDKTACYFAEENPNETLSKVFYWKFSEDYCQNSNPVETSNNWFWQIRQVNRISIDSKELFHALLQTWNIH